MGDMVTTTWLFEKMKKPEFLDRFKPFADFHEDCKKGTLPAYSLVEPRFFSNDLFPANDQHPSAHTIWDGELLLKEIYESLRASPLWEKSALLITYDEHGGLYDHVPSPQKGIPNPDGINSNDSCCIFNFTRLGIRVPTILVSPWVEKGSVEHYAKGPTPTSHYEHSSLPATLKKMFGLKSYLTKRDEWAGTFDHLFNRTTPRTDCPLTMPTPRIPADADKRHEFEWKQPISELQQNLITSMAAALGEKLDINSIKNELEGSLFMAQAAQKFLANLATPNK
jgi:phospholipase C